MRLVSFVHNTAPEEIHWGLWMPEEGYILDATKASCLAEEGMPATLLGAVQNNEHVLPLLARMQEMDKAGRSAQCRVPLAEVSLRAPYTNPPRNILCTGLNYHDHLKELKRPLLAEQKLPEHPFIFTKPCTAIAHPEAAVDAHTDVSQAYDYEVELAVIIGKNGKNIPKEQALEHVFGYSVLNDMSARDLQRLTTQWYKGKALDESAPFGPCIACKDSIADPQNLHICSRINGEERQKAHTSQMIFDVATLVHLLSQGSTLQAGDIIATGTPAGVGMSFEPPKFLKSGDLMELEIQNIGILRNTIA